VTTSNDQGLFTYDPLLGTQLIAREADLFDVGGGVLRKIDNEGIFVRGFTGEGVLPLSNDGRLWFSLRFADGSSGIFLATFVPEPSAHAISTVAIACLAAWPMPRRRGCAQCR
jgi:hypothetical protein